MKILWDNKEDKKRTNVIYQITLFVGNHNKQYHYIGKTKRELQKRIKEHIYKKNCTIYNFINTNKVKTIKIDILKQCNYYNKIILDTFETIEICKYFKKRGTKNNKNNRLINIDLKGLDTYSLKDIKIKLAKIITNYGE